MKVVHKGFKEFLLIEANVELEGMPSELKLFATEYPDILISDCDVINGMRSLKPEKKMMLFSVNGGKLYSYFPVKMLESAQLMKEVIDNFRLKVTMK